jgi:3-oxoacyl-[acyl-carrier protein] reductase
MTMTNAGTQVLAHKVAVVPGGARGIGGAVSQRLALDGARVIVNYVGNREAADGTVAAISAHGGTAMEVQADVSNVSEIKRLFDVAETTYGRPDIVVLAPGNFLMKPLIDVTEAEFDKVFALNARGVFFVLQEAAKRIADNGAIVSISSGATALPGAGGSMYAGSKSAAEQFTTALAKEIGARGVSVNTVSPSITRTDGLVVPPPGIERLKSMIPFGRIGEPEDIANVIAFLVSPQGHWVNGQNVRANGGMV